MLSLLPTFEDLSAEQEHVYRLPLDSSSVVTGPPGTGKTVLALYRAQRLMATETGFRLLTHAKPLKQYVEGAARELGIEGRVETFHSFLWHWWKARTRRDLPSYGDWEYDWDSILSALETNPRTATFPHLIVDEGQDLPPMFWFLRQWLAASVTIFADEHQRIREHNSTVREILANAQVDAVNHHVLTRNYRNTKQIHDVAMAFVDPSEQEVAEPPTQSGDVPELIRFDKYQHEAEHIARAARNRPDWQIGVLAPSDRARKRLANQLQYRLERDNIRVQTYSWQLGRIGVELEWDEPGVYVLNYASGKGLQFEHVFLPRLELANLDPALETTTMTLYVMVTRARRQLTVSWNGPAGSDRPVFADRFPTDRMDVDE